MKPIQQDRRENVEEKRAIELLDTIIDLKDLYGDIINHLSYGKVNKMKIALFKAKVLELYVFLRPKIVLKKEYSDLVSFLDYFIFNPKEWKSRFSMKDALESFFLLYEFCERERLFDVKSYSDILYQQANY